MNEQTKKLERFFPLKCPRRHRICKNALSWNGVSALTFYLNLCSVYPFSSLSYTLTLQYTHVILSILYFSLFLFSFSPLFSSCSSSSLTLQIIFVLFRLIVRYTSYIYFRSKSTKLSFGHFKNFF